MAVASGAATHGSQHGRARTARRRSARHSKFNSNSPASNSLYRTTREDAPPRPQTDMERLRATLAAAMQSHSHATAERVGRGRSLRGASKLIKPPFLPVRPQTDGQPHQNAGSATTAAVSAARKPKTATAVPKFNDLYVKAKSTNVSKLLQQLANVS